MRLTIATLLLALAGACAGEDPAGRVSAATTGVAGHQLDVLFVIDDSGSMGEEQATLAANFPRFMQALEALPGGLPDVHVGVVSSNIGIGPYTIAGCWDGGDEGILRNEPRVPGCTGPVDRYIADAPDPACEGEAALTDCRVRNYAGTLAETFSCIAQLGTMGCGFEQHLGAMKTALDPAATPENAGFRRPDAFLAVVVLADEDDCSADTQLYDTSDSCACGEEAIDLGPLSSFRCTEFGVICDGAPLTREAASYESCEPREDSLVHHPQRYVDFLQALEPDPSKLFVSVIAGNPEPFTVGLDEDCYPMLEPSCDTSLGYSAPAIRLDWFRRQFPLNRFTSICQDDLSGAMTVIGADLAAAIAGYPAAPEVDPEEPPPASTSGCSTGGRASGRPVALLLLAAGLLLVRSGRRYS